jgi:uncharacterized RDD family membrane protein YckC
MENPNDPQENLLADFEINLQQASTGKRFLNWLIDLIAFYILFALIIAAFLPNRIRVDEYGYYNRYQHVYRNEGLAILIFLIYLTSLEALTRGKTFGKLLTKTRAVNQDGSPITAKTAFLRALSRIVPFEAFSALGSPSFPWHDKWTNTYVIDETESTIPPQV